MRAIMLGVVLSMAVLLPRTGTAQVYAFRTPPPAVTAESADWQLNDEPILVGGVVLWPTRETRFFDGQIMSQVGTYERVPVYADVTLEPWSVVYVPTGRNLVRGYERRRAGELAGTEGSRMSAFPIDSSSLAPREQAFVPTSGIARAKSPAPAICCPPFAPGSQEPPSTLALPGRIESIPGPTGVNGVWLEFQGARWYSSGPSVEYSPNRFDRIGDYRGFPVYHERNGSAAEIWVPIVQDGPLAPYARR
jgi:hypothetical protein